uniref:Restriction endonuclease n=1 Tax=Marseillevirus LCMAC103 TaxID=2506604 RepID=A0A481YTZ8_9VIRU|nr:MAG: restriction endonuclease [Marseillevirus LCMAC103]
MFGWRWVTVNAIFAVVVLAVALYYAWHAPKKKYPFTGIRGLGVRMVKKKKGGAKANKAEEKCRRIFEAIFGRRFKSVRPAFLKSPVTGKNLELDGFCPSIKTPLGMGLAFEYDGIQHSEYRPYFHRHGPRDFIYQQKKDSFKDQKCREMGILLVRIPHFIPSTELRTYIRTKLARAGVAAPPTFF